MKNSINFNIEIIISEYSNYVFKIVNNIVGTSLSYQDKEEIVSDVFYLLWKNQNNIKNNLKSYIGVVARNCSYSRLRKEKIDFELKEYNATLDYKPNIDDIIIIKQKIDKLTKEEKNIFDFYYVYGYRIKEISKKLKLNPNLIKIKLYRIRKKLKEEIR